MADIQVYKRVVDYVGINAKPIPERSLLLFKDLAPVLALLQGMGSDGASLLKVDANGSLLIAPGVPASSNFVVSILDQTTGRAINSIGNLPDGNTGLLTQAVGPELYDGATWRTARMASALNVAAQSGQGAALTALPGEWTVDHEPATGALASASKGAGGAGVRHVAKSVSFTWGCTAAPAAAAFFIRLRDGASGAGAILKSWVGSVQALAGISGGFALSGLNIVGSPATAMTLEFSVGIANLNMVAAMSGYDVA